jgi:5-methylthioadenosine/S-adenosylhomocysteine deaminase
MNPDCILHARWVAQTEKTTQSLLEQHAVVISQGRIVDILPSAQARMHHAESPHVELPGHLLLPGFINLHTHAAMSLMRGIADDLPLMDWLSKRIWPAERTHVSARFVRDGTRLACAEMLMGGITCFNDMYFFPEAAAEAAVELGMRAVLGILALEFPSPYASDSMDYLSKGLAARDVWKDHPRLRFCLAPHSPYAVHDACFEKIRTYADQLELPIHLHIHETEAEIRQHLETYGIRPLARLERLGLLGPQLIGVHAVHLDSADMELLARANCSIAHCPTSNLKLGSGIAPVPRLIELGINVGLGTDGAASNNRLDLLAEMRLASLLAKGTTRDAQCLRAWQALRMATIDGARALGMEREIGSIEVGKHADIIAIDLAALELQPCFDPISHLVNCAGREHVSHVWIAGACCVFEGKLTHADTTGLKNALSLWQNRMSCTLQPEDEKG